MNKMDPKDEKLLGNRSFETLRGPAKTSHWILWLTVTFILVMLVWSYYGKLDETTSAIGKVIPSKKVQVVQYFEGGRIDNILVEEGQKVEAGQVLMTVDDTRFTADYNESQTRILALLAKAARLKAEIDGKEFIIPEEVYNEFPAIAEHESALYQANQSELEAEIDILENQQVQKENELLGLLAKEKKLNRSYKLVKKELAMTEPLVKEGAVSEVELLRLQRATNDLEGELNTTRADIPRVKSQIDEAKNKIEEARLSARSESLDKLSDTSSELTGLRASTVQLKDRVDRASIVAPVTGTVKQIHVNTRGGVISPGMDLIEIVPADDTLLIEARVKPADIAFLRPGLSANVKISAYDYSIYGTLPAKVEHISADTTTDETGESYYEIWVRTEQNYIIDRQTGEKLEIWPGMNASASVVTGNKSVLNYILKPIIKTHSSAMHEK